MVNKIITDEANKVIDEINKEQEEKNKKLQEEYAQKLTDEAVCLSNKLESYSKNKGGSNSANTEFNNWVNECGASDVVKNLEVEIDGKKVKLEDALKQGIDQVKDVNKRGTMEGCKWATWPWSSDSCIANGVGEIVHHTSEFLGDVISTILAPTTSLIETTWNSITTGKWDNFVDNWLDTSESHKNIIDNNVSSITKNTLHGIGRLIEAVPGILVNGVNAISAVDKGLTDCVAGKACSWENVNSHYDKNTQAWQDTIGWNGGDWLDNINVISGAAVTILGVFIGGPIGGILASMVFSYTLATAQNGVTPTFDQIVCENKKGFDCVVNATTTLVIDYLGGKVLDGVMSKKPKKIGADLLDGNKKPKKVNRVADDVGIPCLKFSYAPNSVLDYAAALFSLLKTNACSSDYSSRLNDIVEKTKSGNIPVSRHAAQRAAENSITYEEMISAYNGTKYQQINNGNIIYYKDGVGVAKASDGTIITVIDLKKPSDFAKYKQVS